MLSLFAVEIPYWGQSLLRVLGGLVAVLLPAGTIVYVFLFKMMSFMQSRLGPMEAGPYGSMQLFAEVGKWLQKEDIQPDNADKRIFRMAPIVVLMSTFLLVAVVPFGPDTALGKALTLNGAFIVKGGFNRRDMHAAEIPAANGISNAPSLARMYAATIGEVDGANGKVRLISEAMMQSLSQSIPYPTNSKQYCMGKEEFHWLRGAMHSWFSEKLGSKNISDGCQLSAQFQWPLTATGT